MTLRVTHSTTVPKMEILARSILTKTFAILLFCPFSDGHTSSDVLEPRCNDTETSAGGLAFVATGIGALFHRPFPNVIQYIKVH